jgi:uncharacterized protein
MKSRPVINAMLRTHSEPYYVYKLFRPSGEIFYVGKGKGNRVFQHEIEASGPNKSYKLNIIRSIRQKGQKLCYDIEGFFDDEIEAYECERGLITSIGRHDLGTGSLANLSDGGGGPSNISEEGKERHRETLAGDAASPERAAVNAFFQRFGSVGSVAVKPLSEFKPVPLSPHPQPRSMTPRQAAALAVSAVLNRVMIEPGTEIPRIMEIEGIASSIENGVGRDILKSQMAKLSIQTGRTEMFELTRSGAKYIIGAVGVDRLLDAGVIMPD